MNAPYELDPREVELLEAVAPRVNQTMFVAGLHTVVRTRFDRLVRQGFIKVQTIDWSNVRILEVCYA